MKENITAQPVSNEADANGLNVVDKHKKHHFSHQALERYPLMPTWRVYRMSYWPTSQHPYACDKKEAVK